MTLILVGWALFAWVALLKIMPSCATSRFRYQLWRMRDELVDEIRHREYHDAEQARRLLREIEVTIARAEDLTITNVVLAGRVFKNLEPPRELFLDLSVLSGSDRERLRETQETLRHAMARHVLLGRVTGWPILIGLILAALIGHLFSGPDRRGLYRDAKQQVRDEIKVEPVIRFFTSNGDTRHLSAHV